MEGVGPAAWLAWINVVRSRRRTLLTILPSAAGLAALLLLWSLDDALRGNLTGNFQDSLVGSIQVHRQGFFDQPRLSSHLGDAAEVIAALDQAGVRRWTPRLETYALAIGPGGTTGMMLIAIDPARETRVTNLHEKVGRGRFFQSGAEYACLLGESAARNLGVGVGDAIDLIANDRFGAPVGDTFIVAGIIEGGGFGVERDIVFVPLASAQELLEMGSWVTDVVMRVDDERREPVRALLRERLDADRYEVMAWNDMFPVMEEWVRVQSMFEYFFIAVVLVLVAAAVGNVALVSSLNRRREFGVMLAVGESSTGLWRMLMSESLFHGLIGCLIGLLGGMALVHLLAVTGVDMGALVGGGTERYFVDPVLYPRWDWPVALWLTLAVFGASLMSGLYPAWRASRLEPLEAFARG
jgi:ABC-type lipoprotein release transport system permease subunit